jgi:hypothetical protein
MCFQFIPLASVGLLEDEAVRYVRKSLCERNRRLGRRAGCMENP